MPTASELVEETRSLLESGARPEMNRISGTMGASDTTLTLEFPMGGIQRGAVLAIELEHVYVWSVSGQVATVSRAWGGTTAVAHADDTLVWVNPRWSAFTMLRAINEELASYSSPTHGLFRLRTVDLTYSASRDSYDLTSVTDVIDVYDVRYSSIGSYQWPRIPRWSLARNQDTTAFPSGYALTIWEGAAPGRTVRVQYKAPFGSFTLLSQDLVTQTGLPATAADIPPLGAAARLVAPREVKRAFTESQAEPRSAEAVPPGANRNAAAGLLALRNQRLMEESARLHSAYPHLSKAV